MGLLAWTKALIHRVGLIAAAGIVVVGLLNTQAAAASPAPSPPPGSLSACLKAVSAPQGDEIACNYLALPTPDERADIQKLSRGLLQDARCTVKVRIARKLVEPALTKPDHVFTAPPQPVTCDIKTKEGGFPIEATFAPTVTFKGGTAVDGSPGLANVTGINKYLAWPIVQYVNRAPGIRKSMLEIINLYRAQLQPPQR